MKAEVAGSRLLISLLFVAFAFGATAQKYITAGKVVYERRTNLEKRFKGQEDNRWMRNADLKKPKIDEFELFFTDSTALFQPILSDVPDSRSWFTMRNTTYQDLNAGIRKQVFNFMGTEVHLEDTLNKRVWRMTESTRNIAGYDCRQALWIANDTTRIYAWYAEELVANVGPETFNGLPGVILGLAIEDGGVVYFAKEVKKVEVDIDKMKPKPKKKDIYTEQALRDLIKERFGAMGSMIDRFTNDIFLW